MVAAHTLYMRRYRLSHKRTDIPKWRKARPEYNSYANARQRCENPNNPNFKHYGARGIRFLFDSFAQFMSELGSRPDGLTLDRIDNDGNYEPGNVRWADWSTQNRNQRQ